MSGLVIAILLHENLNTEGISNEISSEGCVKWRKIQIIGGGLSTLGLTLAVLVSLTKVNLHIKNGSAIFESPNYILRFRDQSNASNIDGTVYYETTSMVNRIGKLM